MPGHPGKRTLPVHAIEWSAGHANGGRADEERALSHLVNIEHSAVRVPPKLLN
ncbi:hypothetical protein [Streptomyces griseus]|uniref:hypothetical protein n=1 Tax=Streptomyces griseus TaxID=1911 RepID=UPI000ADF8116|nr:hypothetical protein [Streptomyces griseus]